MARNQKNKEKGNGEGTLYKSGKTRLYVGQYVTNGKRHSVYQKKNEKIGDFKKRFNDILSSINQGSYIEQDKETFIQILEKHIEQKHRDNITGDASYTRDLNTKDEIKKTCSNFVNKSIQKITVDDIEYAKDEIRKYANNSINKIWRLLYKTFSIAVSRRKITFNPMDDETLTKPISDKETKQIEALTISEEQRFIDCLNDLNDNDKKIYKQIVSLQLNTGMRIGEILALSKDCIDLEKNTITVYRTLTRKESKYILGNHTKTYNRKTNIDNGKRTFPMSTATRKIIMDIMQQKLTNINNLLFWDYETNNFILPRRINRFLDTINENNIFGDLKTHKLRHTFITRCQEKGVPLVVIQAMVGHIEGSSITNDVYTSVSLDFMAEQIKKIN